LCSYRRVCSHDLNTRTTAKNQQQPVATQYLKHVAITAQKLDRLRSTLFHAVTQYVSIAIINRECESRVHHRNAIIIHKEKSSAVSSRDLTKVKNISIITLIFLEHRMQIPILILRHVEITSATATN